MAAEVHVAIADDNTGEWAGIQESIQFAREMEGEPIETPESTTAEASFEHSAAV